MSEVKVNKLSPRSGTTVTIGDSGDTINIVGTLQNNGAAIPGDISSVVAGTGLSGGGTSGDVTINIEAAQPTITSLGTITTFRSTGIDDNADALAMTIDSSENVGIGTASPVSKVNIEATKEAALSSAGMFLGLGLTVDDTTAYNTAGGVGGGIAFRGKRNSSGTQTVYGAIVGTKNGTTNDEYNGNLRFFTNNNTNGIPTEHMRINNNGNIMIANTTESGRLHISSSTSAGTDPLVVFSDSGGTDCGSIDLNASANTVAYTTSSDYRLKENVSYDFDATTRIKQLKPARFNFIADADTTVDGFLAHEVSSVVPEAITGEKDAVKVWKDNEELPDGVSVGDNKLDENGNTIPDYQGIDQAKLVPLLVKTIQELEARITALETTTP